MSDSISAAANGDPQWWLSNQGTPDGPHSEASIQLGLRTGAISPQTFACPAGGQEWRRLFQWPSFATVCGASVCPPPPPCDAAAGKTAGIEGDLAASAGKWLEMGKSQTRTVLNDLRQIDYRRDIVPIDAANLAMVCKDRVFWFTVLLGIVPLMIGTLADTQAQLVLFALFFAGVWGVLFRAAVLKHAADWRLLLAALFFTGILGTALAGKIESFLLPEGFPLSASYVMALVKFILVVGLWEEVAKIVPVVVYIGWKRAAADPMTILLIGVFSGLGFAAFENLVYNQLSISLATQATIAAGAEGLAVGVQGAMAIAMLRSLSLVFCHGVWGGIFAYFFAVAATSAHRWAALVIVGLALTAVLHGAYDWLAYLQPTLAALTAGLSFVLFYGYVTRLRQMIGASRAVEEIPPTTSSLRRDAIP